MPAKSIGQSVRDLRVRRGYTQARLAQLAGMTGGNVSQIETGITLPGQDTLERIAMALEAELVVNLLAHDEHEDVLLARLAALIPRLPPAARQTLEAFVTI